MMTSQRLAPKPLYLIVIIDFRNGVAYQINRAVELGALGNLGDVVGGLEGGRLVVHILQENCHLRRHGWRRIDHCAVFLGLEEEDKEEEKRLTSMWFGSMVG